MRLQLFSTVLTLLMVTASLTSANPLHINSHSHDHLHRHVHPRDTSRFVFAHIIVGLLANRNGPGDWDLDMQRAKEVGIDAFALNVGTDDYTEQQLTFAYDSANKNGIKCFISFDFNWWSIGNAQAVGTMISKYGSHPAQLQVDSKIFASTFVGDGLDVSAVRAAAGKNIYFAPNFKPSSSGSIAALDCAFNWMGWPSDGNNRAPTAGQSGTVEAGDQAYISALSGKDYMAPVSPWFFTHYGKEVSYSKNWVFPGDTLWYDRWTKLLEMKPRFIEIVSWNDYGESHYVGPLNSPHTDDGASKWVNDMPHDGWLEMAKPFIAAYKAGASSVNEYIKEDQLIYWYRPQSKNVNCDATDTCMAGSAGGNYYLGKPDGWDTLADSVFVVTLLKSAGTLEVTSGSSTKSFQAPAGASIQTVSMGSGKQSFSLSRDGQTILSGDSAKDIIDGCVCGIYNFNAYVGTIPNSSGSSLTSSGFENFAKGLKVLTCAATPSLGSSVSTSAGNTSGTTSTTKMQSPMSSSVSIASTLASSLSAVATSISRSSAVITSTSKSSAAGTSISKSSQSMPTSSGTTKTTTSSAQAGVPQTSQQCNAGAGPGNYAGLCSFACFYGYCPPGTCTCTSHGSPNTEPTRTGVNCVPADGLDQSYSGLCSFACDHGYYPEGACKSVAS